SRNNFQGPGICNRRQSTICCNVEHWCPMREMTVREANQNFSKVIAAAERGETIVITKNGTPVAKIAPQAADRTNDPEWRAAVAGRQKAPRGEDAAGCWAGSSTRGGQ